LLDIHGMAMFKNHRNSLNWGVVSDSSEPPQPELYPADILATASLTERDAEFLRTLKFEDLTLPTETKEDADKLKMLNIQLDAAFDDLLRQAADIGNDCWGFFDPREWVNDLSWLLPSYSPDLTAQGYIDAHGTPAMTVLYLVARRSGFWNKCLAQLGVDERIDVDALCPDPIELFFEAERPPRDATGWKARQREYYRLLRRPDSDPSRQLMLQLDLLTQVTATQVPALKQFLDGYQQWLKWEASF
jgi:hypothetical protein